MNSDEKTETEKENKNTSGNNIHEHIDSLAQKTFIKITSSKRKCKMGSNIVHNNLLDDSKNDIDDELFYENFMVKLNIKSFQNNNKQRNENEFFYKKTTSQAIKNPQLSKTPKLLRNKKIIHNQICNNSHNNSIGSIKSSGAFYAKKNKKTKHSPRQGHSPFLVNIPKGNHSGRVASLNNHKSTNHKPNNNNNGHNNNHKPNNNNNGHNNTHKPNNNNNGHNNNHKSYNNNNNHNNSININHKRGSSSFLPIEKGASSTKNEIILLQNNASDEHNNNNDQSNYKHGTPHHNANITNNNNANKKNCVKDLSTTKTQKTSNEDCKIKNLNNNNGHVVTVFGETPSTTINKETKKSKKFCFFCCIPKKISVP